METENTFKIKFMYKSHPFRRSYFSDIPFSTETRDFLRKQNLLGAESVGDYCFVGLMLVDVNSSTKKL